MYSRQKIDFLSEKRGLKEIEVAEQLGISKMVSASLSDVDSGLALEVQIIDIKTGLIEGSHETRGSEKQLIEMQNEAAIEVMRSLKLPVDQAEVAKLLADRTNDRLDSYKLLTESMGGGVEPEPSRQGPHSAVPRPSLARLGPKVAEASEGDEAAIRALLERYRAALEAEDMVLVESLHVALPNAMRTPCANTSRMPRGSTCNSRIWTSWWRATRRSRRSRAATIFSIPRPTHRYTSRYVSATCSRVRPAAGSTGACKSRPEWFARR